MYGFPLTLYLLSGWLGRRYPELDLFSHDAGHLWTTLLGVEGDPHFGALRLLIGLLIGSGFVLLANAWRVLYRAQVEQRLATTGPYAYVRHPQYVGFVLILSGFLVQWPTLLMFLVLVAMDVHLARREEREALAQFGQAYTRYADRVPAFMPRLMRPPAHGTT